MNSNNNLNKGVSIADQSSSNFFEFIKASTLFVPKHVVTLKGHVYSYGDFTVKIGSVIMGKPNET